jgi:hypothetical protein
MWWSTWLTKNCFILQWANFRKVWSPLPYNSWPPIRVNWGNIISFLTDNSKMGTHEWLDSLAKDTANKWKPFAKEVIIRQWLRLFSQPINQWLAVSYSVTEVFVVTVQNKLKNGYAETTARKTKNSHPPNYWVSNQARLEPKTNFLSFLWRTRNLEQPQN